MKKIIFLCMLSCGSDDIKRWELSIVGETTCKESFDKGLTISSKDSYFFITPTNQYTYYIRQDDTLKWRDSFEVYSEELKVSYTKILGNTIRLYVDKELKGTWTREYKENISNYTCIQTNHIYGK